MFGKKDVLFCEMNPFFYKISEKKEILKRHLQDKKSKEKFAKNHREPKLRNLVAEHSSGLIKRGRESTRPCNTTRLKTSKSRARQSAEL